MPEKRLYRSRTHRVLAGVLGGVAQYFDWDPALVRVAYVVLSIFPGSILGGVVVYAVAWLVVPEAPETPASPPLTPT